MKLKLAAKESVRPRRAGRRSPPPPAILHGPDETLDGVYILDEMRNGVGVLLWQSLHDVILWASVPPGERRGLFRPESVRRRLGALVALGADPVLEAALTSLAALSAEPDTARPEAVGSVCLQIARWADANGSAATALAFAQGAAMASPGDASAGLLAGTLARKLGERARAETWLRRTIVLGRRNGDRMSLFQACLVLGEMQAERGDVEGARGLFLRAFRGARRSGFREIKAQALHGLFRLAAQGGRADEADGYARSTLHAYGRRHPRVPQVARDIGTFWLERGKYNEALAALRLLLPYARRPADRVEALAAVARAAAGARNEEAFDDAAGEALQLLRRTPPEEMKSRPLLDLARGAAEMERWESAERAAQLALDAAVRSGEDQASSGAEALLTAVWTHGGGMRYQHATA
ncbi:MAG: hypothetical protein AB1941_04390 [Gemmatimonadota bacterium]